ncbi:RNA-directed DNA polymerase [Phytophthora palmivora]|uniref:RNA-directed DNA polymerase n=1 Tax=Phytophthora palmivora TaxID=4796 RepID=A0A2P4XN07_9STRA|nr:RNA-directed DNA polymerase [Phytophthora palmivora]
MITGSESDGDSPGSAKDPSSSQDAPSQDAPAQDAPPQDTPVDDAESSEAKAASTSSPAKSLTLAEGKARAQAAKAASPKRAGEGAAAAKRRAAPGSPTSEPSIAKGSRSLFDSSDEGEEEGSVSEPQEISNDLDAQQERYQASQLQGAPVPPAPVYNHGYYPPDAGSGSPMFLGHLKTPRGLNHVRTSWGAYEPALVQDEPLFVNNIEAARARGRDEASPPKPLRLKVNPYEGNEGDNLHFGVREVELAMDAALILTERPRVAYALSTFGGRAKTWAYTREATTPGCFTTWAQLCQQLRAAFLPANYEYHQRSRFLVCKQGKRELHEYIQEMRVLAASLVGNSLPEHIKVTVFMDGLKCGKATVRRQAQCKELQQLDLAQGRYPWNWTVAWNGDKYADALREREGRGQVSVRLADGTVVNVPGVRMDLAVKFEDFDSMELFLVLDMNKDGRQGAYAPEEVLGVTDPNEDVAMSLATGRETKAHCQACGIVTTASPNAESRRAVWASTVAVPDGTDQAGNIGPQAAEAAEESAACVSCVAEAVEEDAECASGVGNIAPHKVGETEKKNESAACVSSVGNRVPRGVKKTSTRAEVSLSTSRVDNQAPHSESETPPARLVEEQYHVFDGESGTVHEDFLAELKAGEIAEMGFTKQRATRLSSEILKNPEDPVYPLVKEFSDVWPLPREWCEVIDAFFAEKAKPSMVRESKSPHSTPTFCVRKPNGKWRLVHAYNKLNNATVPAQTPIPSKDVLLNNMSGCTLYSTLDLVDGNYQILMRESDIPVTAVSTPSGMIWEWLVMPQWLSNAPATFNRLVTQLFRPLRTFAQTYFDDIFVHSRAEGGQTAMEVHLKHLRRVFEVMRANKLYANIDKCVFAAEEIKFFSCFVSRIGVCADPGKVKAIAVWPTPRSQKDLRKWLGLANYLHKYSAGYAELARPLSDLLKKDADWVWEQQHQDAFNSIKESLQHVSVLALPDENKPFSVVCDASDYAISCALLQKDNEGHERVISFQPRQLKAAERNYPVHDKELLAMKYALVKFRRMARWLSFFAEYNFCVEYKPGKLYVLADALSHYKLAHVSRVTTDLYDRIRFAYQEDENYTHLVRFLSEDKDAKVDRISP